MSIEIDWREIKVRNETIHLTTRDGEAHQEKQETLGLGLES